MDWRTDDRGSLCRVSPFRNPRLNGYLLLTAAYRSLSRLSSALSAKASTLRSFQLNLCRMLAQQGYDLRATLRRSRTLMRCAHFAVLLCKNDLQNDVLVSLNRFRLA